MYGFRKQLGFYLAILVAFFNATGISASEPFLDLSQPSPLHEAIEAPDYHKYWASEEIFNQTQLPQYSETQFSGFGIGSNSNWDRFGQESADSKGNFPFRDLRTSISILIFPFHFFL